MDPQVLRMLKGENLKETYDFIVVGPLSLDVIKRDGKEWVHLGGTASYTSVIAARLGARVGIVSTVGPGIEQWTSFLKREGLDLRGLTRTRETLRFETSYAGERRTQRVEGSGSVIGSKHIPPAFLKARCFHFGPLFNDVAYDVIDDVARLGALTSLDPQGYLRKRRSDGTVVLVDDWPEGGRTLCGIRVLKLRREEARAITHKSDVEGMAETLHDLGPEIVLITEGARGSVLYFRGQLTRIPGIPADVRDPTGAGDVYAGAFLVEYLRTGDAELSAYFASAASSLAVEAIGVERLRGREAVVNRLKDYLNETRPSAGRALRRKLREG